MYSKDISLNEEILYCFISKDPVGESGELMKRSGISHKTVGAVQYCRVVTVWINHLSIQSSPHDSYDSFAKYGISNELDSSDYSARALTLRVSNYRR